MNDLQKRTTSAIVNVFETGRVRGDYGAIAVLKGDKGHLSYGRSQTTLGSGGLFRLLDAYCQEPAAQSGPYAAKLKPLLPRFESKDTMLDTDIAVHDLLRQAGQDPVMQAVQDQFFSANFMAPACREAEQAGVMLPLGQAVVYDSHIQGGWIRLRSIIGPVGNRGEQEWVKTYIGQRRTWLLSLEPPVPSTVYRMDSFATLIQQNKWDLALPLTVHGVTITEDSLESGATAAGPAARTLRLTSPYMRGDDVRALQEALAKKGLGITPDGIYGPFTETVVKSWQAQQTIPEDGVGPKTRTSLGL